MGRFTFRRGRFQLDFNTETTARMNTRQKQREAVGYSIKEVSIQAPGEAARTAVRPQ